MTKYPVVFTIEFRNPQNKDEASCFGETCAKPGQAQIFINARRNRNREELLDTLMHEMYHAVVGAFNFSTKNEEQIAWEIGRYKRDRANG